MRVFLVIALLIAIVAVIFSLQNPTPVTVTLFAWQIHTSLAVALLVALVVGALVTILFSLPGWIRHGVKNRSQKKKFSGLQVERDAFEQKLQAITAERDQALAKLGDFEKELSNLRSNLSALAAGKAAPSNVGAAASSLPATAAPEASAGAPTVTGADKPSQ